MKLLLKILLKGIYNYFNNSSEREFIRLTYLYGDKKRYISEDIKFLDYQFSVPDCLSFVWQFKDIFVEENYKFKAGTDRPLILDCGANIGLSCLYFKRLYPNSVIKAYEADPQIARILSQNIQKNKLNNVEIIDKAVWTDNSGIEISHEGADGASIYSNKEKFMVNSVRLKDVLEKGSKIDFLKMDIEGAECDVIEDCKNSLLNVENLFIEYHAFIHREQDLDKILEILRQSGFRYFIRQAADRKYPFINKTSKHFPEMDLQLNIFAYRNDK